MPKTIVLLEDDPERLARFDAVIRTAWPHLTLLHWSNAHRMIAECPPHLPTCAVVCLDHDLVPVADGGADAPVGFATPLSSEPPTSASAPLRDPGDGLDAARFLAAANIPCPVLIHSSNADGAYRMRGELELAGCTVRAILPFGRNWIEHHWRATVEELLAG